jgi:gas vesicle protein
MSGNQASRSVFSFIVGICVGAAAVILMGSKRIDQLRDHVVEALTDGLDEFKKDLKRQTQKTVHTAQQKVQEVIDAGIDAYSEAKRS